MVLRAVAVSALLIGLATSGALAQFLPPPPLLLPPPFQPNAPQVADDDDDLPPYDPPPGYRAPGAPGAPPRYSQPPQTYTPEALPPPGPHGATPPGYEPYQQQSPGAAPGPRYGSAPPGDGLRPPGAVGSAPHNLDPDVTSRLPMDDRPETGPRKELPPQFRRTTVDFRTREPVGTIVIDTANTYLYLVLGNGKAMRYGIGVGREGFTWTGAERVSRMAEWPDWHPPSEMIERQPYLPRFMAGGEGNPLGARALYLGKTLYRIHGTNQPSTIGSFVSSGCIRLTNEDIIDLFYRVKVGTRVVVLPGKPPASASNSAVPARPAPPPSSQQADNYNEPPPPLLLQPPGVVPTR